MEIRELRAGDVEEGLSFRNAIFNNLTREHWDAMGCTAVVAREAGTMVGFIPLQFRRQVLRPGVDIPVVYENAVGVAEAVRGRGIGTRMIAAAAELIADRADALMVIRGGEQTEGYRFYRKTGHGDLCYARSYRFTPVPEAPRVTPAEWETAVVDRAEWSAAEPEMLALYRKRYGVFGGGRLREAGYWDTILRTHVYREHVGVLFHTRGGDGRLAGYLMGLSDLRHAEGTLTICEAVGEDDRVVESLLRSASAHCGGCTLHFRSVTHADPLGGVLQTMGAEAGESEPQVMCRILNAPSIFRRLSGNDASVQDIDISVRTPHRTVVVNKPKAPRSVVKMQMKEHHLSRLLTCRLDLAAAVRMDLVRWEGEAALIPVLSAVLAYTEWVQTYADYV